MDDIVERLRSWQCASTRLRADFDDAADEIERLRAKLAEARRLLTEAAEYVRGFEDEDCGEPDCPECAMGRIHREIVGFLSADKGDAAHD